MNIGTARRMTAVGTTLAALVGCSPTPHPNQIQNPSFESNTVGWQVVDNAPTYPPGEVPVLVRVSGAGAPDGKWAAEVIARSNTATKIGIRDGAGDVHAATTVTTYAYRASMSCAVATTCGKFAYLFVEELDASGNIVSESPAASVALTPTFQLLGGFMAPQHASDILRLNVLVTGVTRNDAFYADNLLLGPA